MSMTNLRVFNFSVKEHCRNNMHRQIPPGLIFLVSSQKLLNTPRSTHQTIKFELVQQFKCSPSGRVCHIPQAILHVLNGVLARPPKMLAMNNPHDRQQRTSIDCLMKSLISDALSILLHNVVVGPLYLGKRL